MPTRGTYVIIRNPYNLADHVYCITLHLIVLNFSNKLEITHMVISWFSYFFILIFVYKRRQINICRQEQTIFYSFLLLSYSYFYWTSSLISIFKYFSKSSNFFHLSKIINNIKKLDFFIKTIGQRFDTFLREKKVYMQSNQYIK